MKLRLQGDTVRLRLSRSDLARLVDEGRVAECIHIAPGAVLSFAVQAAACERLTAAWDETGLTVGLPRPWLDGWADDDRVGFEGRQDAGAGRTLRLAVEKDFACGHRPSDAAETFPRPPGS